MQIGFVQPLRKTLWRFIKELKMELPCDPVIAFLGIYLKKPKTSITNLKDHIHPHVHCNIIYNNQAMETTQVPINRQMDK